MSDPGRKCAVLDKAPECQHLFLARFDPADFLGKVLHTAGGVLLQCLIPLFKSPPDVVEAFYGLVERLREVGKHRLEFSYAFPSLVCKGRAVCLFVCHGAFNEQAHCPIIAPAVLVIKIAALSSLFFGTHAFRFPPDDFENFAVRITACSDDFLPQMFRYHCDVSHHAGDIREHIVIFSLEYVSCGLSGCIRPCGHSQGVIDEARSHRLDGHGLCRSFEF